MTIDATQANSLYTLGVPGLVAVVLALCGVTVFLFKQLKEAQTKNDANYEQRISDAKETRDKITEPLEKQAVMSEKTYDLLLNLTNRRK